VYGVTPTPVMLKRPANGSPPATPLRVAGTPGNEARAHTRKGL